MIAGVPEADLFRDDKLDVLEVAGLGEAPNFLLLELATSPDPNLLVFLRLLNLSGTDSFLLESIFRDNCWM